jgi:hypothetical protein
MGVPFFVAARGTKDPPALSCSVPQHKNPRPQQLYTLIPSKRRVGITEEAGETTAIAPIARICARPRCNIPKVARVLSAAGGKSIEIIGVQITDRLCQTVGNKI